MTATVQMNTRINPALKAGGDVVLRRNGYTPSGAVQALWSYLVESNSLPSFMPKLEKNDAIAQAIIEVEESSGLALKMQEQLLGISQNSSSDVDNMSYDQLKELSWEDRGAFDD